MTRKPDTLHEMNFYIGNGVILLTQNFLFVQFISSRSPRRITQYFQLSEDQQLVYTVSGFYLRTSEVSIIFLN